MPYSLRQYLQGPVLCLLSVFMPSIPSSSYSFSMIFVTDTDYIYGDLFHGSSLYLCIMLSPQKKMIPGVGEQNMLNYIALSLITCEEFLLLSEKMTGCKLPSVI